MKLVKNNINIKYIQNHEFTGFIREMFQIPNKAIESFKGESFLIKAVAIIHRFTYTVGRVFSVLEEEEFPSFENYP